MMRVPTLCLLLISTLTGCAVVQGDGEIVTDVRDVGAFRAVELSGALDASVAGGEKTQRVEITCDANLLPFLVTEVQGATLHIHEANNVILRPTGTCSARILAESVDHLHTSGSGAIYAVNVADLNEASTSGSGPISVSGIDSGALDLSTSGSGEITAAGETGLLRATTSGSGEIDARELQADAAVVRSSGSGDVSVRTDGTVTASTSGSGDIHIYGDPTSVDRSSSGSGEIRVH